MRRERRRKRGSKRASNLCAKFGRRLTPYSDAWPCGQQYACGVCAFAARTCRWGLIGVRAAPCRLLHAGAVFIACDACCCMLARGDDGGRCCRTWLLLSRYHSGPSSALPAVLAPRAAAHAAAEVRSARSGAWQRRQGAVLQAFSGFSEGVSPRHIKPCSGSYRCARSLTVYARR